MNGTEVEQKFVLEQKGLILIRTAIKKGLILIVISIHFRLLGCVERHILQSKYCKYICLLLVSKLLVVHFKFNIKNFYIDF